MMARTLGHKTDMESGKLLVTNIGATAGNVVTTAVAGGRARLVGGRITLVCDATVTNRLFLFDFLEGANILMRLLKTTNVTASQTYVCSLQEDTGLISSSSHGNARADNSYIPVPKNNIIEGLQKFNITISNGQAGDSYSGFLLWRVQD